MGKKNKPIKQNKMKYDLLIALPLVLVVTIVPLIVYLKVVPLEGPSLVFTNGQDNMDFFSYYKMVWLLIFTGLGLCIYFTRLFLNKTVELRKDKVYYPLGAYLFLAIASTIFATYRNVALIGFVDRYEGLYSIIAYVALFFLAFNAIDNEKQIKAIIVGLGISSLIISLLGVTQFIGKDFFMTDFGKSLILPNEYRHLADSINFTFASSRTVYGTLYNINYVGVYMSMVFALSTTIFILVKDYKYKIFFIVVSLTSFLTLLGSRSRAGMFSIILYLLLSMIFFRKFFIKHWKAFTAVIVLVAGIFIGFNQYRDGFITNVLKSGITSLTATREYDFQDIILEDNTASIVFDTYSLTIISDNGQISFLDENNQILDVEFIDNTFRANKEPYNKHTFELQRLNNHPVLRSIISTNKGKHEVRFVIDDNNEIKVLGYSLEYLDDIKASYVGFEGRESMASNRGYIWSRTIPMLKDTLLVGHGPDTYALHFPNNDYVGKMKGLNISTLVDKPHNIYLQIAINTGVLSLLAYLVIFFMYFVSCLKVYYKRTEYNNFIEVVGLAIFLSILIYLFTGISNDSLISIAPIFWILLGLGFMVNNKVINFD